MVRFALCSIHLSLQCKLSRQGANDQEKVLELRKNLFPNLSHPGILEQRFRDNRDAAYSKV